MTTLSTPSPAFRLVKTKGLVPRILLEEGLHGEVTWAIEQGAVGGIPLLGFGFGCSSNADAIVPSPNQFTYFQGAGFDLSLLSFLQIDRHGSVNVSKLGVRPHVTAGAGGFVDITARAKRIVFFISVSFMSVSARAVAFIALCRSAKHLSRAERGRMS